MADTPATPPRLRTVAACLLLVGTVLVAGCIQSTGSTTAPTRASEGSSTAAESTASLSSDDMESRLVDLAAAADPAAFADAHGIDYDDGRVPVVVTLRDGASLPEGHDAEVDLARGGTVHASVPVGELGALAAHENVTFVRTPREPSA